MRIAALLLSFSLVLAACDAGEEARDEGTRLPVQRIDHVTYADGRATFGLYLHLPTGCVAPSHEEIQRDGQVVRVTVYGERRGVEPCPDLHPDGFYAHVEVALEPGTYTFRFWQSDVATVDTTVTLP